MDTDSPGQLRAVPGSPSIPIALALPPDSLVLVVGHHRTVTGQLPGGPRRSWTVPGGAGPCWPEVETSWTLGA
eukprot:6406265-Alexandrium_andersonii.AAC.1